MQVRGRMRAIAGDPGKVRLILSGFGVRVPDGAPTRVGTRVIRDGSARVLVFRGAG
jgi:hypothetical protein